GAVPIRHDADVITAGSCANRYVITRVYHATDVFGNSVCQSHTNTLSFPTPRSSALFPVDKTVSCATDVPAADDSLVTATDLCGGAVTISHDVHAITAGSCANRYVITRVYHATDVCGNSVSQSQTITEDDKTAPAITI